MGERRRNRIREYLVNQYPPEICLRDGGDEHCFPGGFFIGERVRKGAYFSILCVVVLIETIGAVMFVFAPQLVGAFSSDPLVIAFGTGRARVCSLFYFTMGFSHLASAVLRGLDRPVIPTVVLMVCWCLVRVVSVLTIGQVWHRIELAYWLYPVTWMLSTVLFVVILAKEFRKRRQVRDGL